MDGFKDLMLNLLFILTPMFLYHLMVSNHRPKRRWDKLLLVLLPIGSVLMCLKFPLYIEPGYLFSLSPLIIVISFLYGNIPLGLATATIASTYRLWIGGGGLAVMVGSTLLMVLLLVGLTPLYRQMAPAARIASFIGVLAAQRGMVACVAFALDPNLLSSIWKNGIFVELSLILLVLGLITVYLLELIRRQSSTRDEQLNTEKLKMISELAASVSHEVRNPLTVTQGFIQLLRQPGIDPDKQERYLQLALEELRRAQSIITDFLSFAKPQMEHIELIEIEGEMQYVIGVMSPYALMQNVILQYESPQNPQWVKGDRQKMRQCFINLMKNSIEAMPDGGTLYLHVNAVDSYASFRIEDTGVGMDDEQLKRLGKPYYSTKEKGTGLGTMVVFRIVEAMGGLIRVHSEKGKGTVFTILLPLDTPQPV